MSGPGDGLSPLARAEFLAALRSSGTEARLRGAGLTDYLGPAAALPGVVCGYRAGGNSLEAEVWYFESYDALTRAQRGLAGRTTSNGAFLVRVTGASEETVSACLQSIAGEE